MIKKSVLFDLLVGAKCPRYEAKYIRCIDGKLFRWSGQKEGVCKWCKNRASALNKRPK